MYDVILIGGGHNGLVCATRLAQAGLKTLVLERRATLGGAAATEEILPGLQVNTGADDAGLFAPELVEQLQLRRYGLEFLEPPVSALALQPEGPALALWRDPARTREALQAFSKHDAETYPEFCARVQEYSAVLRAVLRLTPPDLRSRAPGEWLPWSKVALKLRGLGRRQMMQFLRVLPMSVKAFLDEWFESEVLKGALGCHGVRGTMQGPYASGTAFVWLYHQSGAAGGGLGTPRFVRGGVGRLCEALARAAQAHGVDIRAESEVQAVQVRDYRAVAVVLQDGEEIPARAVVSNADPARTFLHLVGAPNLGPQFVRKVRNIRYRGCTAKMFLALSDLPRFTSAPDDPDLLSGALLICPGLDYLERAYDDAKYGRFSRRPFLRAVLPTLLDPSLAPEGRHLLSVTVQYAPYHLRGADWDAEREKLGETVLATLSQYAPEIRDCVLETRVLTPLDYEREYGLTEGHGFHGEMGLDQLLFMRPVPGFGRYRTPVDGLFLCGAGTHPGGGVTGLPGWNCAREVLRALE